MLVSERVSHLAVMYSCESKGAPMPPPQEIRPYKAIINNHHAISLGGGGIGGLLTFFSHSAKHIINVLIPDTQCMAYLPTFV